MICTSYFSNLRRVQDSQIIPVSVAQGTPRGIKILEYKDLAPPWSLIKQYKRDKNVDNYIANYSEGVLRGKNQYKVLGDLILLADAQNIALICFEKPGSFCHRHLIAAWLNSILPRKDWIYEFGE